MTRFVPDSGFEGVFKIIRFNTRFYAGSALGLMAVLLLLSSHLLFGWIRLLTVSGAVLTAYWTLSSILVSWYVYDYIGVTRWEWMRARLQFEPRRWANIHAGLDESTTFLRHLFAGEGAVVDIYDPAKTTEPSIARARRLYPATEPFEVGSADALPLPNTDRDAIFLLFAAHELRAPERRTQLLRETCRVLKESGRVVLVEHLRSLPNFLAFGPGFLHFHSGRNWLNSIQDAGFEVEDQSRVTPFVHCFVLRKAEV
jgi:ubiquinone/menaquinone biosynthesis C-methylase UbiE